MKLKFYKFSCLALHILVFMLQNGHAQTAPVIKLYDIESLISKNQPVAALDRLNALSKAECENPLVNFYRAQCYYVMQKYDSTVFFSTRAIASYGTKDSFLVHFYGTRMSAYIKLVSLDSAIQDINSLIDLEPNRFDWYQNLSYVYGEMGDMSDAIKALKKALLLGINNESIYNNLAYYSGQMGEYATAIKYANKGLEVAKDSMLIASLLNSRGYAKLYVNEINSGVEDINKSIEIKPDNSFAYYNRAIASIALGDSDNICLYLYKAKSYGGINLTEDLISKYCIK